MNISSLDILKTLQKDGWYIIRTKGSHVHFRHTTKEGIVTVPHPSKDLNIKTIKSIEKQSAIKLI